MTVIDAPWAPYAAGSEVDHFADFCAEHLVQSIDRWDGLPLELEEWQRRLFGEALAYGDDGWPTWNSVVMVLPRKNGKTCLLAAYAIYRLLTSEGSPEILLAASSDKQADRLFKYAATFVRRSPELSGLCRVRDYVGEIVREDGMGIIYRLASDPHRAHGYNPTLVVADELAQWVTPKLEEFYTALTTGGGARSAPQVFTITTAGRAMHRHDSILGRMLDAAEQSADVDREPGLLVGRLHDSRMLIWSYEAPTERPEDVAAMKLANPATWITEEYLARQAANPELSESAVLQLHGCVWAEGEETWLPRDAWDARAVAARDISKEPCVLGFDGSHSRDATVLMAATLDGYVFVVRAWERPAEAPDEWRIPRGEVDAAVEKAMRELNVVELVADPAKGWGNAIDEWRDRYGAKRVLDYPCTNNRMAPACGRFRAGVFDGELTHGNEELLGRHISHCAPKETIYGITVRKAHPEKKIDAAVAAVMAYDRAMDLGKQKPSGRAWGFN